MSSVVSFSTRGVCVRVCVFVCALCMKYDLLLNYFRKGNFNSFSFIQTIVVKISYNTVFLIHRVFRFFFFFFLHTPNISSFIYGS